MFHLCIRSGQPATLQHQRSKHYFLISILRRSAAVSRSSFGFMLRSFDFSFCLSSIFFFIVSFNIYFFSINLYDFPTYMWSHNLSLKRIVLLVLFRFPIPKKKSESGIEVRPVEGSADIKPRHRGGAQAFELDSHFDKLVKKFFVSAPPRPEKPPRVKETRSQCLNKCWAIKKGYLVCQQ